MILITQYYESTARERRYGTYCSDCRMKLIPSTSLMRANLGKNSNNCTVYSELCLKCYKKKYRGGIKTAIKAIEKQISEKKQELKKLRGILK